MVKKSGHDKNLINRIFKSNKPKKPHMAGFSFAKKESKEAGNNAFFEPEEVDDAQLAVSEDSSVVQDATPAEEETQTADSINAEKAYGVQDTDDNAYVLQKKQKLRGTAMGARVRGLFAAMTQKVLALLRPDNIKKNSGTQFKFAAGKSKVKKSLTSKRIAMIAGGTLIVIAALLVVFLVPRGKTTETDADVADADSVAVAAVVPTDDAEQTLAYAPDVTPEETALPPIETTPPDVVNYTNVPTSPSEPIETTPPEVTTTPIDINDLVDYFMVEADKYYNDMHYSTNYYEYTEEEWFVLAQVIDGEAGSQTWEGKVAVGNVVMNRVLAPGYPGSDIITVVTARGQFSGYFENNVPNRESKRAARAVLDDQLWTVPQHSFNFNSHKPEGVDWGIHAYWKKIDNHNFYVDQNKNRSRCRRLSIPPALFKRTYKWPRYGCKPESRVKRIQLMLRALDYSVDTDSYFGMDTVKALKKFQADKGLDTDGVAGPTTIKKLIQAYGLADYYQDFCM